MLHSGYRNKPDLANATLAILSSTVHPYAQALSKWNNLIDGEIVFSSENAKFS